MVEKRPDRTLGAGHDEFWAWCAKGELRLQKCGGCGKVLWPVMAACDGCGGTEFIWERLSGRGKLVSWCTFVRDYYRGIMQVPYDTIGEEDCVPGLAVEVRFIAAEDSAGAFSLPVFAKAE